MPKQNEIDDAVLEEGSYYLNKLGSSPRDIAEHFEIPEADVRAMIKSYSAKLKDGTIVPDPFDETFWDEVRREAEGDVKVTFVSEKGFHHGWKSELRKLDGPALMSIFEASKDFTNLDPNQRFLEVKPPRGYDPLILDREVTKALGVISELLGEKWKESRKPPPAKA